MQQELYKGRLTNEFGIEVLVPNAKQQKDTPVPLYDTTAIHAQSAVAVALGNN
jgi:aspartate/glutamate racemase